MNNRDNLDRWHAQGCRPPLSFLMLTWAALLLSVTDPASAAISARPITAEGTAGGRQVRVEVIVAADSEAPESVLRLIAVRGARTAGVHLSDDFFLSGLNPQFMDRRRDNDYMGMSYNPGGEPVANTATALRNAQSKWNSITGSAFRFSNSGLTSRTPAVFDGHQDIGWLPMGATPYGVVLGLTVQVYMPDMGSFYESDIMMNSDLGGFGTWITDPAQPGPPVTYDVESVLLHELGHVAGLSHSPNPEAVMFYWFLATARELTSSEEDAMRYLYPRRPVIVATRASDKHNFASLAKFEEGAPYLGVGGLDKYGNAAFVATVSSEPYGEALFLSSKAGPVELLRFGDAVAGLTLGSGSIDAPTINGRGDVAVAWILGDNFVSPFGANAALLRHRTQSGFELVVNPGKTSAPGGGKFFGSFGLGSDDDGNLVFGGYVSGPLGLRRGVFVAKSDGGFEAVMRPGDPAPGGGTFLEASTPSISARGNYVAFAANLDGLPGQALFLKSRETGSLVSVLRPGSPAPGGGTLIDVSTPRVNSSGDIVFGAVVSFPYESPHIHVYRYSSGTLEAITSTGDLLPDGWTFIEAVDGSWGLNDSGNVVLTAIAKTKEYLFTMYAATVFTSSKGTLTQVSRDGDVVFGAGLLSGHRSSVIGPGDDLAFVSTSGWSSDQLLRAAPQVLK